MVEIRALEPKDLVKARALLLETFADEPLNIMIGVKPSDMEPFADALLEACVQPQNLGLSFVGIVDGEVVGIALATLNNQPLDDNKYSKEMRTVLKVLERLYTHLTSEECTLLNDPKSVHLWCLGVRASFRNRKIGGTLSDRVLEISKKRGAPRVVMEATSHWTYLLGVRKGFKNWAHILYNDVMGPKSVPPPHTQAALMLLNP